MKKHKFSIAKLFDNDDQTLYFFELKQRALEVGLSHLEFSNLFIEAKNNYQIQGDAQWYAISLTKKQEQQ